MHKLAVDFEGLVGNMVMLVGGGYSNSPEREVAGKRTGSGGHMHSVEGLREPHKSCSWKQVRGGQGAGAAIVFGSLKLTC